MGFCWWNGSILPHRERTPAEEEDNRSSHIKPRSTLNRDAVIHFYCFVEVLAITSWSTPLGWSRHIPSYPEVSSYYEAIARIPLATLTLISRYLPRRLGSTRLTGAEFLDSFKASIIRTMKVLEPHAFQQTLSWHSWFILKQLVCFLLFIWFLVLVKNKLHEVLYSIIHTLHIHIYIYILFFVQRLPGRLHPLLSTALAGLILGVAWLHPPGSQSATIDHPRNPCRDSRWSSCWLRHWGLPCWLQPRLWGIQGCGEKHVRVEVCLHMWNYNYVYNIYHTHTHIYNIIYVEGMPFTSSDG